MIMALTRDNTTEQIELTEADAVRMQKLLTNYLAYRSNEKNQKKEVNDAPAG